MSDNAPTGLYLNSGTVHLEASIVANHSTADCGMNTNVPNTFVSDGYNVVENPGACLLDATDVTGQDPLLVALADNGGHTMTRALTVSSPAVDWVPGAVCPPPATDQRGAPRPTDGDAIGDINCDAGAFEYGATAPCDVPRKPILVSPANGSTLNKKRVLLKWNPALCADTYNVLVRQGSKGGPLADQASDLIVTQYKTKRLNGQSFYWRVEACDGSVCIPSAWRKFNVTAP